MGRASVKSLLFAFLFLALTVTLIAAENPTFTQVLQGTLDGQRGFIYNGGQTYAKPAFGDVDGDGDLDMYVGHWGGLTFFRNDGTPHKPLWTFQGRNPLGISAGWTSPAFCDIDNDGDADLFVAGEGLNLLFYRSDRGVLTLVTDNFAPGAGGVRLPAFGDLDGDGDFDMVCGGNIHSNGEVVYYRNDGTPESPSMTYLGNVFGIDTGGSNDTAYPELVDLDGDGDLDLLVATAHYPQVGIAGDGIWRYENVGTPSSPNFVLRETNFLNARRLSGRGSFAQNDSFFNIQAADLDGDHDADLVVSDDGGMYKVFTNTATPQAPVWDPHDNLLIQFDTRAMFLASCFYDIDGDGDQDLFCSESKNIAFYRNVGSPTVPIWKTETHEYLPNPGNSIGTGGLLHPFVCDIDGDGDGDMFVTDFSNDISPIYFFENIGTPKVAQWSESHIISDWQGIQSGKRARLSFGDLDADGDYDLLVSNNTQGETADVRYYENKGTRYAPSFPSYITLLTPTFPGGYQRCQPSFSDMDRDGDLDIVVVALGSAQSSSTGWVNYFENKGTPQTYSFAASPNVVNAIPFILSEDAVGTVADLNGDGYDDILCGDVECGIMYFQQNKTGIHIAPGSITTTPETTTTFEAEGYTAPLTWSFAKNSSGASPMVPSGSTASYTAGAAVGTVDAIEVRDSTSKVGRAYINVISPSQLSASGKAVVIAGRKAGDALWETTNELAHYVFRTLLYRGFSKENVLYLNPQTGQDVDGNGNSTDDIDGASSLATAQQAFTTFAQGSPNLFVYLIDHGVADSTGANGQFRLNETELLSASQLDTWLDALQFSGGVTTLTLVVDCCQSGSFLAACSGAPAGKTRVVVASASATQPAFFSAGGLISFTNSFVGALSSGLTVGQAFHLAAGGMDRYQQPALDDDGDGVFNKDADGAVAARMGVGASFIAGADRPQIGVISANQTLTGGTSVATLWASDVSSVYPVDRVWATIAAPGFISDARIEPGQPVVGLPQLELPWNETNQRYEATTSTFTQMGAYAVNIYAEDIWGGVAYPKQTYINQMNSDERMLIVCGDGAYDSNSPWSFSDYFARSVYETARARWLANDKIAYLTSASNTPERPVDGAPTQVNIESAISAASGIGKFTVYLVGKGNAAAFDLDGDGAASDPDDLTPAELDAALDTLQNAGDTTVIVVLDFTGSGSWVAPLQAPAGKKRVVIASCSAGEASWCEEGGVLSFTQWFFSQVFNGVNVRDSFNWSRNAVRAISSGGQNPLLDDDGSGVADRNDGALALATYIGAAFVTGADAPAIGDYAKDVVLGGVSETVWASGVSAPDGIAGVHAYVILPGATPVNDLVTRVDLGYNATSGRWEATYSSFDPNKYQRVVYFAEDRAGQLSEPYAALFGPSPQEDIYDRLYNDDTTATLNFFSNDNFSQKHNLWMPGDEDWALFNADANRSYSILVMNQSSNCDAKISLFHESNLATPLVERDDWGPGGAPELISWWSGSTTGTMFVKVIQSPYSSGLSGEGTSYTLKIFGSWGPNAGLATISGVQAMMTATDGGLLKAGPDGIYTKPEQSVPTATLSADALFALDDPGDIGNHPWFDWTKAWRTAHPGNSNIVQIRTAPPVTLNSPVPLTIQFVDDGPTFTDPDDGQFYTVDDLPLGSSASAMRIHTWTGSSWAVVPGVQTVIGDTVSMNLDSLGSGLFAVAPEGDVPEPVLPEVSFSVSTSECFEGDGSIQVAVSLTTATLSGVTVSYSVGGTAAASVDYGILSGSVTIEVGQSSASVTVSILDDSETELDETLILSIIGATNANLGSGTQHVITIHDNDGPAASTRKDWTLYE